jgi:DNA mismatch endonuclease (patch repair protein)
MFGISRLQPFKSGLARRGLPMLTTADRSRQMATVRQSGTVPELAVRRAAAAAGLRFTLSNRDLPGSPDLANRARRFALFVHGCFWHRHSGCPRTTTPTRNRAFWMEKFSANVTRDRRAMRALRAIGYTVIIVWECQTVDESRLARTISKLAKSTAQDAGPRASK